ncbi:hypothetical protein B296_00048525 [Ensete ventricosum]|uniref:Uncharacterized protein n=1 Tax=Ensete ventricosum TaxID=4639 RepID=A0A426YIK4_ENSVE|nr:hypothetical protein B296_00048525 [Ensete ventricosum]
MGSRTSTVPQKNSTVLYFAPIVRRVEFRSVFRAPSQKFKILVIPDVLAHVLFRSIFRAPSQKLKIMAIPDVLAHVARSVEFHSIFRAPSRKLKIMAIPDVFAHGKSYEHGFWKKRDGHKLCAQSRSRVSIGFSWEVACRSVFHAPSRKFKILAIPDVSHGKSYEHGFMKKHGGHKLCVKSRSECSFHRFFMHRLGNSKYGPFPTVEFRSIFHVPSQKFKIQAIPDILALGKSYEHDFPKKCDGHKLYAKSRSMEFRLVFHAPSRKFKILAIPDVFAHGKLYEHGFAKKLDGHKLCANRAQCRVSISFSCTVPKIQNIGHYRRISP